MIGPLLLQFLTCPKQGKPPTCPLLCSFDTKDKALSFDCNFRVCLTGKGTVLGYHRPVSLPPASLAMGDPWLVPIEWTCMSCSAPPHTDNYWKDQETEISGDNEGGREDSNILSNLPFFFFKFGATPRAQKSLQTHDSEITPSGFGGPCSIRGWSRLPAGKACI